MKLRSATVAVLVATGLGTIGSGCGGGGGSGGGGSSTTAPVISGIGPISSGLPSVQRDPQGYRWSELYQANRTAGGYVTVLGTAATSTATIVAHAPLGRIDSIDQGISSGEAALVFDATSIARVGTQVFIATGNEQTAGAGDIYGRDSTGRWSLAYDAAHSQSVIAALGSECYAFSGEYGGKPATVSAILSGSTGFVNDIAVLGSCCPTAAVAYRNQVWVGAASSERTGGAAQLFYGSGLLWKKVDCPSAGGFGREKVTALLAVKDSLVLALGTFDVATGQATGGAVFHFNGQAFELMTSFSAEAPLALAFQDSTVYVGTSKGRLLYRDKDQAWVEEPSLPANGGIRALHAPNGAELLAGVRGSRGALVLRRVALSGGIVTPTPAPTPTPTPTPPAANSYLGSVRALMQDCNSCHRVGGPAGSSQFVLSNNLSLDMQDWNEVKSFVNATTPAQSPLLTKATGTAHGGGARFSAGSAPYTTIMTWINAGQRFN